ncbi:hypothetical protein VI817_004635 [Penicillium citrinum]|nr:hypothetical protein VI817_004635 [Penicillium citrinum]
MGPSKRPLDLEYAEQMQYHPYGTALYRPQPRDIFHPGMVGYFNEDGDWNPIIDLSQKSQPSFTEPALAASLTPPDDLPAMARPEEHTWGPKLGDTTRVRQIDLSAGIGEWSMLAAAGAPISLESCYRFENMESTGAVLITGAPILHERFYHATPFKRWVVSNATRLLAERTELKKNALWVITSIWSAEEAAVNCWREHHRAVDVGFKVGFVEIGELAPKGKWVDGGSSEGWIRVKGDEGLGSQNKRTAFRGESSAKETVAASLKAEDGMEYDLSCESILEDESLRPDQDAKNSDDEPDQIEADGDSDDDW